jgi:hypothetical protein
MAVVGMLMFGGFRAFYGGSMHALGQIGPYTGPLICIVLIFNLASGKGNTPDGRVLFRLGIGTLVASAAFLAVLPFVPVSDIEKDLARSMGGLVVAIVMVCALVVSVLRPLWARRTLQRP